METYMILLIAIIVSWASAQLLKIFFIKPFSWKTILWGTGGMPSSHSSSVMGLVSSLFVTEGFSSLFVVSLLLAAIVLRDAVGVRYAVGQNARVLEKLAGKHENVIHSNGHTLAQVIVGALIGLIVGSLIAYLLTI